MNGVPETRARKLVQKKLKIRGYAVKVDALERIISFIKQYNSDFEEAIDVVLDCLQLKHSHQRLITKDIIDSVVGDVTAVDAVEKSRATPSSSSLVVIDAFSVPKFRYDSIKKQFIERTGPLPIYGEGGKEELYKGRFLLLSQRMSHSGSYEIVPIQSLIGQMGRKFITGLISQLEDGHFYLEDQTACVKIDISNSKIATGLIVENTIVIASGHMGPNGIFEVFACGFPPLEDREKSRKLIGQHDFFGSGTVEKEDELKLNTFEQNKDMFVIVSEIWLDNEQVMEKLETMLNGFESQDVVPSLFVFMGNFCSHPCNISFNSFSILRSQFAKLGEMIKSHPRLNEQSQFLFIPGPEDIGASTALPRCSLPNYFADEVRKHVKKAIFASNPCRVKFYTQEIVFFRHDLMCRMQRSCLIPPSVEETKDVFEHLVATLTHQSHLCPLPLIVQPINWNYDHSLHLHPLPHTIVLGDKSEQKYFKYGGVTCFNPGSFSQDCTFAAYRCADQEVELSAL